MSYRGAVPPLLLILAATAGTLGCDNGEARRQHRAEEARKTDAELYAHRQEAETAPPTEEVLEQVRAATYSFLADNHPDLTLEGVTFTALTPNLFLVGASVKDVVHENRYVSQLTAERLRDEDWDGEFRENGQLLWVVDYATAEKLRAQAQRHGFGDEMDRIRQQDPWGVYLPSWGRRSWLDEYLLWHYVFHRPVAYGYRPGGGFSPMAPGYRFQDPDHPIDPRDAARFQVAAAPTGGRSMVFLGGNAWRPPLLSSVQDLSGQAYTAGPHGSITVGRMPTATAGRSGGGYGGSHGGFSGSRGGFGAAGHSTAQMLIEDLGWDEAGVFRDLDERPVRAAFKLYPWEFMVKDAFGPSLARQPRPCTFLEPAWKMLLSNKALLAILWELFPRSPYLLPAYLDGPRDLVDYVRKPILAREGANVELHLGGRVTAAPSQACYGAEGHIHQAYAPIPEFDGFRPVLGAWIVDGEPAGMGIREARGPVTDNGSAFVPHLIED